MAQVVIKLRHLDTDARKESVVEVERVPDNALRQSQHLAELVAARHPQARPRSFADGVASFVDSHHLIIARYLDGDGREILETPVGERQEDPQDQLFAV